MTLFVRHIFPWLLLGAACCVPAVVPDKEWSVPPPAPVCVKMVFAGDVMQHMPQVEAARRRNGFDYDTMLSAVKPRFDAADLVVVNLETTLTHTPPYTGYPCFRSPLALASALSRSGADVAVMANNHCCDGGGEGVHTTIGELTACGIRHTGVFTDSLDHAVNNPLYLMRKGVKFALLNYTYGTNGIPVPSGIVVNRIDTAVMAADLAQARDAEVDCTVVCMHWGNEYERRENAGQRELAAFLRRHGADVIIGSHPHVIQPVEADSAHVVVYSLGNFVSNQRKRYCDGGLVAEVEAIKHPDGRMTYTLTPVPVWVSLPDYRVLPPEAADTMTLPVSYRQFREDTGMLLGTVL